MLALLKYWQDSAIGLQIHAPSFDLKKAIELNTQALATGKISLNSISSDTSKKVWIAPWWAQKKSDSTQVIAPLWIPAEIHQNQLVPCKICPLPWIDKNLIESIEYYDKQLLDNFFDETEAILVPAHWESYLSACLKLFNTVLKPDFKICLESDYIIHHQASGWMLEGILLPEDLVDLNSDLNLEINSVNSVNSVLISRFTNLELASEEVYAPINTSTNTTENNLFTQSWINEKYSNESNESLQSDKNALKTILNLNLGDIQALHIPKGSQKNVWIHELLILLWIKGAIEQKRPVIVCITDQQSENNNFAIQSNTQIPELEPSEISKTVQETFKIFQEGMTLAHQIMVLNNNSIEQKIEAYQNNDQALELEFERCTKRYQEWQQKYHYSVWSNLKKWLPKAEKRKQKLAIDFFKDYLDLESQKELSINLDQLMLEKIRKIKVSRTKIHTELVEMSQVLASKNGINNRWLAWIQKLKNYIININNHNNTNNIADIADIIKITEMNQLSEFAGINIINNINTIQYYFRDQLFELACIYFKLNTESNLIDYYKITDLADLKLFENNQNKIDYLFIDNAHKILPAQIMPWLKYANRAIFLGNNNTENTASLDSIFSPLYDRTLLKSYGLASTEEDLEELSYRGIQANGSAFCMAKAASAVKIVLEDGFTTLCELSLSAPIYSDPKLYYVHIKGNFEVSDLSYKNLFEAQAIVNWLVFNTDKSNLQYNLEDIAIITVFKAQKDYLNTVLLEKNLNCRVYLLNELETVNKKIILFSSVYTALQPKPYILDQKQSLLPCVLRCANQMVIFFGDMAIFDPFVHTPSGQVAKKLFNDLSNQIWVNQNNNLNKNIKNTYITRSSEHQAIFWSTLKKAQHSVTIVSSQLSEMTLKALEGFLENNHHSMPIKYTLYLSERPVSGLSWKAPVILNILSKLSHKGVQIILVSGLHANILWIDNDYLIQGTQPWLNFDVSTEGVCSEIVTETQAADLIKLVFDQLENPNYSKQKSLKSLLENTLG